MVKERYRDAFEELKTQIKIVDTKLEDMEKKDWQTDFGGQAWDLWTCYYWMGDLDRVTVMVKRGKKEAPITVWSYDCLRGFNHPSLLQPENFYAKGWLIFPRIDGTLKGLMKINKGSLFEGDGAEKDLSTHFRAMLM